MFILLLNPSLSSTQPLSDIKCLQLNLYHEARGEGIAGMLAVAEVTMNRVKSPQWPNQVCQVVYQNKQFSWTHDDIPDLMKDRESAELSALLSQVVLNGLNLNLTKGATHYHSHLIQPYWTHSLTRTVQIGNHIFYN
ncbi:cell wall hydrolase [Zooshikella ganghwensis]|uniref:cell wall hydrolase n=1 Tax=Zooshikella ganghwensis TaxID=202772 RepID=UPI003B8A5CEB